MKASCYREAQLLKNLYFPQPLARYPQPQVVLPSFLPSFKGITLILWAVFGKQQTIWHQDHDHDIQPVHHF